MPTKTKISTFKKSALVLSGGFTKAASWHLGVALGLEGNWTKNWEKRTYLMNLKIQ